MRISVSILMPMRNAEAYIVETIESLLNQTFTNFEIIVVNDGSTDSSQALVECFADNRIRIIQGNSMGISAALNMALSHAKGDYVCRCDADDSFPADRLFTQTNWLEDHSDFIAVAGKFSSMDEKSNVVAEYHTGDDQVEISHELLNGKTRTHLGTFLIKSSVLKKLDGFREYFITAEDIDMQFRLAQHGLIGYLPKNMYFYRIHQASITHVQSSNKRKFYENTAKDFLIERLKTGTDLLEKGRPPQVPDADDKPSNSTDQIVGYMIAKSWGLHQKKQKKAALVIAMRACMKQPLNWNVWKNMLMILVKN